MGPRKLSKSVSFTKPTPEIEDEILELYSKYTEEEPDLVITKMSDIFEELEIPKPLTRELTRDISDYSRYEQLHRLNPSNQQMAARFQGLQLVVDKYCIPETNIVDIDKLIHQLTILIRFRENYEMILETFRLFANMAETPENPETQTLNLKDLVKIKNELNANIRELELIDMLGINGNSEIGVLDMGYILGYLDELR